MSYYETVAKPRQAENARLRAKLGSPEGARFLPGGEVSYCVRDDRVHLRRWATSGRCIRWTEPVNSVFVFRGEEYCIGPDPTDEFFLGEDVKLDRASTKGDISTGVARSYYRRKHAALVKYMPKDFWPLPGGFDGEPAAYRVEQGQVAIIRVTTAALKPQPDGPIFKRTEHPVFSGNAVVMGRHFTVLGQHLVPQGSVLEQPLNLPDRAGWAERDGEQIKIITPGNPVHTVRLSGNTFKFEGVAYEINLKSISLA